MGCHELVNWTDLRNDLRDVRENSLPFLDIFFDVPLQRAEETLVLLKHVPVAKCIVIPFLAPLIADEFK